MIDSKTAILLDADMLAFAAASATEVEVEFAPNIWTRHSELPAAREYFWNQIDYWCDEYEATRDDVILCFTERSQFRRDLAPSYKANRKGSKPVGYKAFKNELMQHHGAFMFHRIEADDLIGIFAGTLQDKHVVIASGDKDLNQIPGHHTWINKEDWIITDEEAQRFTYQQALSGDPTDGIPGCPGIGPTSAQRIVDRFDLEDHLGCWQEIVRTYATKGKAESPRETALLQARLTRILRADEYNFKTHEVSLWNPPSL